MRLRQIEVFRAVMLTGSASAAARWLNVSQPVVSRVIRHAETQLGFALFERVGGRLSPTPEAGALFAQVKRAWGEIERVDAMAANLRRGASGLLRVAATPSLATHLLPVALHALRAAHPDVVYDLWAVHTRQIEDALLAYEVDAGLAIDPVAQVTVSLSPVAAGEVVLVAPRPWCDGVLRVDERGWLDGRPYIALASDTPLGQRLAQAMEAAGWEPPAALRVQTYALAATLVSHGLGFAFVDSFTAAGLDPARVVRLPLAPAVPCRLQLMRAAGTTSSVLVSRLVDGLHEAADAQTRWLAGATRLSLA
ncbi:LysR family transcriptional regulator [Denitromonas iodatirespirans]|uniref:LysR family transcriptional regulator n=1 Tax=Denitromonas iodatirespirans TaxID=2795389 RepID=A0A944HAA4_DENI1|nr:LysR substrate-binding domain-containing protein [Denitromonas iodatirespirans]MBT0963265.1 LysR family transcriptional regulator [Denitromonas iodatirespirans]